MIRALAGIVALLAPAAVILVAAAATPAAEFLTNQGDIRYYLERAQALAAGQVPYRDFGFEYPPLALLPMVVPLAILSPDSMDLERYRWGFVAWELVLVVALGIVLRRIDGLRHSGSGPRPMGGLVVGWRLAFVSAGAALALAWRFDLLPALLVMAALWAALARQPMAAGLLLGLGALAKVYPVALVPAIVAPWVIPLDRGRAVRVVLAFAATVLLGLLPFVVAAGPRALEFLAYQVDRGLQIESIGGGLAVLVGLLTGSPPVLSFGFSAVQVEGPLAHAGLRVLPVLTVIGFGVLAWLGWRRIRAEGEAGATREGLVRPETLVALAFASLLVLLVTSKVYSIQYVVWIVPFVALLRGRQFWLGAAVVALSMPIHPVLYSDLVDQQPLAILVLNLRNALVVALTGWLLTSVRPSRLAHGRA